MASTEIKIQCVNDRCKTLNLINNQVCSKCRTPLVKRYMRIMGNVPAQYKLGMLIENRFYYYAPKIIIDTQPQLIPSITSVIPDQISTYLKLFSYRIYLPQIYGCIGNKNSLWLLEYDGIPLKEDGDLMYPELFPSLDEKIAEVSPLRQLNWLWQITKLWQPLSEQKVLGSLFKPDNIRVNGGLIKLTELYNDFSPTPNLVDLGNLFSNWIDKVDNSIQEIVTKIVCVLQQELMKDPKKILEILDKTIYILGNNYYQRKYQVITVTDPGKKRDKNEDSCYPEPKIKKETESGIDSLTIVCDGLGGQKSGEVASRLAIQIVQKELIKNCQATVYQDSINYSWNPLIDADKILTAILKANTKITGINNAKKRKDRARMGTTLVMGLAVDHEIYLAHVGDSRIYWITENSCHQVTIDDDLASREVRLGYGFYREISKNPQNGALLQALGMENSRNLHPHIQRLILDEDCVFLLCSDGLSDFDRVEQYWKSEVSPLIKREILLEDTAKKLIDIAIKKNGHDNATIGLIYCQFSQRESPLESDNLSWQYLQKVLPYLPQPEDKINRVKNIYNFEPSKFQFNWQNKSTIIIIASLISVLIGIFIWYHIKSSNNKNKSFNSLPNNQIISLKPKT